MSYFPEDIPYMSEEELKANGINISCPYNSKIELSNEMVIEILNNQRPKPCFKTVNKAYDRAIKALKSELFTDAEQRIFLMAITREKEKCKEIDGELDGLVNLESICEEIERKVKSVLWN